MSFDLPSSLSPSAMAMFSECPQRFKFYRIDRVEGGETEAQLLGTYVHQILENLYELKPDKRNLVWCRDQLSWLWHSEYGERWESAERKDGDENDFKWRSWWALENYFDLEDPKDIHPDGLETKVEANIGMVPVHGIIDRWHEDDDKITVVDYKTGKPPNPRYEDKTRQQLLFYALAMSDIHRDKEVVGGKAIFVKTSPAQVYDYVLDDAAAVELTDKVESTWSDIALACESEEFPTVTSRLCGWCDYQSICPAFN